MKGSEKKGKKGGTAEGDDEDEGADVALAGTKPAGKGKKPGEDKEETFYDSGVDPLSGSTMTAPSWNGYECYIRPRG